MVNMYRKNPGHGSIILIVIIITVIVVAIVIGGFGGRGYCKSRNIASRMVFRIRTHTSAFPEPAP